MSAELELALLVLNAAVTGDVDPEQVGVPELNDLVGGIGPANALNTAAAAAATDTAIDRFAVAQAFVLGVRYREANGGVDDELHGLGAAVLGSAGVDSPADTAGQLVNAVANLSSGGLVDELVVDEFRAAFGGALEVVALSSTQVNFTGPAAFTATMIYELSTNGVNCRSRLGKVTVRGVQKDAVLVEVDVCTSQPFDRCRQSIDPLQWPACNPYFLSVTMVGSQIPDTDGGWAGVVKERVGCPFNGKIYETDLAVRYLRQPGLTAVAFKLATPRHDDGSVSVDRGFLAAIDEGMHRRIRVLKVYRIENLPMPQWFVCPLWASQVAMAPWWCP